MRKEIFNRELIEKYQGENGWISGCFPPEKFLNDSDTDVKQISVLVSLKNNRVTVAQRINQGYSPILNGQGAWYYSRNLGYSVVAWQPTPKPFKGNKV